MVNGESALGGLTLETLKWEAVASSLALNINGILQRPVDPGGPGGVTYPPSISRLSEAALHIRAMEIRFASRRHITFTLRTPSSSHD